MSYRLSADKPVSGAEARTMLASALERFLGLEYGWGPAASGLPIRPDAADYFRVLVPRLEPFAVVRAWLTEAGVPCFRCEHRHRRIPVWAVVRVPCAGVAETVRKVAPPPGFRHTGSGEIAVETHGDLDAVTASVNGLFAWLATEPPRPPVKPKNFGSLSPKARAEIRATLRPYLDPRKPE